MTAAAVAPAAQAACCIDYQTGSNMILQRCSKSLSVVQQLVHSSQELDFNSYFLLACFMEQAPGLRVLKFQTSHELSMMFGVKVTTAAETSWNVIMAVL